MRVPFLRRVWDGVWPIPRDAAHCPECLGWLNGKGNVSLGHIHYWLICFECGWSTAPHDCTSKCSDEVLRAHKLNVTVGSK